MADHRNHIQKGGFLWFLSFICVSLETGLRTGPGLKKVFLVRLSFSPSDTNCTDRTPSAFY